MNYSRLPTEKQNSKSRRLDLLPLEKILNLIDREDASVPRAVRKVNGEIENAVRLMVSSIKRGGRIFFFGAGTSGRLGVLEAAECPPTFNTPPGLVRAVMAGGRKAVFRSQEGAEDRGAEAREYVRKYLRQEDVAVGISASGVTAFVRGALSEAQIKKASTILIACNLSTPLRRLADVVIAPETGPEIISGSTRLKAGTATKLILNRLTVASMVRLGKVYGNRMVDLQPRSKKLHARALRILGEIARLSPARSKIYLRRARGRVKTAIVMARKKVSYGEARQLLKKNDGLLRKILEHPSPPHLTLPLQDEGEGKGGGERAG